MQEGELKIFSLSSKLGAKCSGDFPQINIYKEKMQKKKYMQYAYQASLDDIYSLIEDNHGVFTLHLRIRYRPGWLMKVFLILPLPTMFCKEFRELFTKHDWKRKN